MRSLSQTQSNYQYLINLKLTIPMKIPKTKKKNTKKKMAMERTKRTKLKSQS